MTKVAQQQQLQNTGAMLSSGVERMTHGGRNYASFDGGRTFVLDLTTPMPSNQISGAQHMQQRDLPDR